MNIDIKPEVLQWACSYAKKDEESVSKKFPQYKNWITQEKNPTVHQMEEFAKFTHVPFGYLVLDEVPHISIKPVKDFRTVQNRSMDTNGYSPDLRDTIGMMRDRQEWLHNYKEENGYDTVDFIGSVHHDMVNNEALSVIRNKLRIPERWQDDLNKKASAFSYFLDRVEGMGVIVFVNSMVGNNTHRLLDPEEFRGFALKDMYAPLIFINGEDAPAARLFTLLHELVHLFCGQDGLDDGTEAYCNRIAALILVPKDTFLEKWREDPGNFESLKDYFRVSLLVVYRAALTYGLITKEKWISLHFSCIRKWRQEKENKREKGGGPDFYRSLPNRIGKSFSRYVFSAVKEQSLLYKDAYYLLGIRGETFQRALKEAGV